MRPTPSTGIARSSRTRRSVSPTAPVAPTTATLIVQPRSARARRDTRRARSSDPGRDRTRRIASTMPPANDSRESESCRIVSTSPVPPNSTSWCATRPRSRTLWIGTCGALRAARDALGGQPRGAARRVALLIVVQFDDLDRRKVRRRAAPRTASSSTAPSAKFGTMHALVPLRSQSAARSRAFAGGPAARADDGRDAVAATAARATATVAGWSVKSTRTSGSRRRAELGDVAVDRAGVAGQSDGGREGLARARARDAADEPQVIRRRRPPHRRRGPCARAHRRPRPEPRAATLFRAVRI